MLGAAGAECSSWPGVFQNKSVPFLRELSMGRGDVVLLVGRDNWQKDEALNLALLSRLRRRGVEVMWEDPAAEAIYCLRRMEKRLGFVSGDMRRLKLRVVQFFYGLLNPSYFFYLYKRRERKDSSVLARCESLKDIIRRRGVAARTIILSRSSGGRVSSLIADQVGVKHVVCLGYPFQHPEQGDEPERYAHLATLKTPMLIIQGTHDEYGGMGIEQKYALGEKVEVYFFDTNHNFDISEAMAGELVALIERVTGLAEKVS